MESSGKKEKDAVVEDSESRIVFDARLKAAASLIEEQRFIEAWQVLYEMSDEEKQAPEVRGMLTVIREQAASTLDSAEDGDEAPISEAQIAAVPTARASTPAKKRAKKAAKPKKAIKTAKAKKPGTDDRKLPLKEMAFVAGLFVAAIVVVSLLSHLRSNGGDDDQRSTMNASFLPTEHLAPDVNDLAFEAEPTYAQPVQQAAETDRQSDRVKPLSAEELSIDVEGVLASTYEDGIVVRFERGIFSRSHNLTAEAEQILASLGQELDRFDDSLRVTIIGHTDNVPVEAKREYADNFELGMLRAMEVVKLLKKQTAMPRETFNAVSYGSSTPPYPNDSESSRARNRTVTIQINRI